MFNYTIFPSKFFIYFSIFLIKRVSLIQTGFIYHKFGVGNHLLQTFCLILADDFLNKDDTL